MTSVDVAQRDKPFVFSSAENCSCSPAVVTANIRCIFPVQKLQIDNFCSGCIRTCLDGGVLLGFDLGDAHAQALKPLLIAKQSELTKEGNLEQLNVERL